MIQNLLRSGLAASLYLVLAVSSVGQTEAPSGSSDAGAPTDVETIVCIRHGERLSDADGGGHDLGQLTPQGLNRSLALPKVLLGKYGKPQYIFAPNPAETIGSKDGSQFCYVRPLATIEPTAIYCRMPVNTQFGQRDIQALEAELRKPFYQNATIFVAWEHLMLERFVRLMVTNLGGDQAQVPAWDKSGMGYDAIYLLKITTQNGQSIVSFSVDHEGLNNLSSEYPVPL